MEKKNCKCTGPWDCQCEEVTDRFYGGDSASEDKTATKTKGGFFDLPIKQTCRHPSHNPPTHIHIPQGQGYKHICPQCGKETILIPPQITL